MADRFARLDTLISTLRDRPGITAGALADQLDVSVRSIFRDIETLRERGYPVESSRGRGGGLRLHPNWGLGRILLPSDEALGVLLSLAVADRLGLPLFSSGLGHARAKVIDAFPEHQRKRLRPLRERILVGPSASEMVARSYRSPRPGTVQALQSAFLNERLATCLYRREDGRRSTRRIEPHALLLNWPAWYLLAHDQLRGEVRTFRLDRFESVHEEEAHFRPRPHQIIGSIDGLDADDPTSWQL
jgi:predicted DNA-binding transcriptional regulator YafY